LGHRAIASDVKKLFCSKAPPLQFHKFEIQIWYSHAADSTPRYLKLNSGSAFNLGGANLAQINIYVCTCWQADRWNAISSLLLTPNGGKVGD